MSLLLKNLRTLSILRHAYSTKRIDGLFAINNLRRELLIDINLPILSRRMASEAIKQIGVEELRNYQNNDKLIIDVREKDEIAETGVLPGGINIPLGDVANALSKTSEDFLKTYGKQKPEKNDTLIFSCRSGKRSSIAAQKAVELGYNNVINFKGGWLEWEKCTKS